MSKIELLIAWRYIRSKQRQKVVSLIAGFSLIGIALGVATLIIVTSVMNGFRKEFTDKVIGFNGHLALYPSVSIDYDKVSEDISKSAGVQHVELLTERHALLLINRAVRGIVTYGIPYSDICRKELISKNIMRGDIRNFQEENAIILGETLARKAHLSIGDPVVIMVPEMSTTGFGIMPRKKTFRLVATFNSGMHEYDNNVLFMPLQMSQILFNLKEKITCISIFVDNPMDIAHIKDGLKKQYGNVAMINDWQASNSSFMKAVEIERNVMFLILTLITLVASFNIISCMTMLVRDKEHDIAILRTIGLARAAISRIFFVVGASIGICGTLIGTVLGLLFAVNRTKIQQRLEGIFQAQLFSPEVYFLTHLPSLLCMSDVLVTVIFSLVLSSIATFFPARKAGKLNPVEILRYA